MSARIRDALLFLLGACKWSSITVHLSYLKYVPVREGGNVWVQHKWKNEGCFAHVKVNSNNDLSTRTHAYFRMCAAHEYCYSLSYALSYDPVISSWREPRLWLYKNRHVAYYRGNTINHNPLPEYGWWDSNSNDSNDGNSCRKYPCCLLIFELIITYE